MRQNSGASSLSFLRTRERRHSRADARPRGTAAHMTLLPSNRARLVLALQRKGIACYFTQVSSPVGESNDDPSSPASCILHSATVRYT